MLHLGKIHVLECPVSLAEWLRQADDMITWYSSALHMLDLSKSHVLYRPKPQCQIVASAHGPRHYTHHASTWVQLSFLLSLVPPDRWPCQRIFLVSRLVEQVHEDSSALHMRSSFLPTRVCLSQRVPRRSIDLLISKWNFDCPVSALMCVMPEHSQSTWTTLRMNAVSVAVLACRIAHIGGHGIYIVPKTRPRDDSG